MVTITKCTIEKMAFPVDGYAYNVQEWRSVDGGEVFAYCGRGTGGSLERCIQGQRGISV